jgi:membrane peptidoglycan carboxypeptidase
VGVGTASGVWVALKPPHHHDHDPAAEIRHRWGAKILASMSRLRILLLVALGVVVAAGAAGAGYMWSLPSVANAPELVRGVLTAHHEPTATPPAAPKLGQAVVAVEDEHFYSNVVVNTFDGAARAALVLLFRRGDPGGSTIAQQLAKQIYPHGPGLGGTLAEIGLGVKLSVSFPKAQVLAMYLNCIYYGHGYWGQVAAAEGYFGVAPDRLDWAQASLLAGLPQAPSAYDPLVHFVLAKRRQQHVLSQLVLNHYLNARQAAAAYAEPLHLRAAT